MSDATASFNGSKSDHTNLTAATDFKYVPSYVYTSAALILLFGVMGMVGNMLLLCVMKRPHLKNKSYAHFLSALAICDTVNILFIQFQMANTITFMNSNHYIISYFNNVGCKIYDFVERTFVFNSAWLIVCITVERFLVIYFPCRGRIFCRAKKALALVFLICVLSCASQAIRLVWVQQENGLCVFDNQSAHYASAIDVFFEASLFYLVPSLTILILNVLTLIRMNGFIRSSSSGTVTTVAQNNSTTGCTTGATAVGGSIKNDSIKNGCRGSLRNSAFYAAIDTTPNSPVEPMNPQQKLISGARDCTASTTSGTVGTAVGGPHQLLLKYFPRLRRNSRRATWILLSISFTYLLCCLPPVVGQTYWHVQIYLLKVETAALKDSFIDFYFAYRFVLKVFLVINYGSNFYTYILFGKSFRKEVTTLLNFSSSSGAMPHPMGNGLPPPNPPEAPVVMMRLPGAPGHYGPGHIVLDPPPPDILVFNKLTGKNPQFPLADYQHHAPNGGLPHHERQQTRYRHMPEFPI